MVLFTRAWFWSWINNKNGSGVGPTVKKRFSNRIYSNSGSGNGSAITIVLELNPE
jgi:hypothetical protein